MSKQTHTAKRTYDIEVVDATVCDLCKKEFKSDGWTNNCFEKLETEVAISEGRTYPEGNNYKTLSFDICPLCFHTKLIPWLESQGAVPRIREVD